MPEDVPTGRIADRLAGFDDHWRALQPKLRTLHSRRMTALVAVEMILATGLALTLAAPLMMEGRNGGLPLQLAIPLAIAAAAMLVAGGIYVARRQASAAGWRVKLMVVGFFGLGYRPDASSFPLDSFTRSGLLPYHSQSRLEDLVYGEVAGVPLVFCDASLRRWSGSKLLQVPVFRGPLLISRYPKRAHGWTVVVPSGGPIGNFFEGVRLESRRARLESPDFERAFAVYTTDQVEARYLLTPTMMERLLALKARFPGDLSLAFEGHELLLALDDRRDWFPDPGLLQDLTDPAQVRVQAEEIARLGEIVEILKLNLESRA